MYSMTGYGRSERNNKNNNRNSLLIYVILVWVEKVPQLRLGYAHYLIVIFYKDEKLIALKSY